MNRITRLVLIAASAALLFSSCAEPRIPQGWALVYGIETYPLYTDLNYTVDDAESIAALLEADGWNVTLRTNSTADTVTLQSDIDQLKQKMTQDDRFLFYFSGHGTYISSVNTEPVTAADSYDEALVFYDATLTDDEIAGFFDDIPSVNKSVIADACYSGGLIGDGFTLSTIPADYFQGSVTADFVPSAAVSLYFGYSPASNDLVQPEYFVLSASGELELSYEDPYLGHGVFTYFLLQAPEKADYNLDGYITMSEAWQYTAASIDSFWNSSVYISKDEEYLPDTGIAAVDPVLFKAY